MVADPSRISTNDQPSPRAETVFLSVQRIEHLIWAFITLGVIVRLARFGLRFPLWEDEAFLAYNLSRRSFAQLLQPLDYIQVAPIGYLWLQRAVIDLLGFSEFSLRATALLAGLASLFLMKRVAALTLPPLAQLFAIAIFAVSYPMIRYSAEAKQYGLDLFLGLTLVWLFLEMQRRPERVRWSIGLIFIAALGPFVSHPIVFIGGGVSLAWVWLLRQGSVRNIPAWLLFNAALVASFAVHFWFALRAVGPANDALMQEFWGPNFPPLREPLGLPLWLIKTLTSDLLAFPIGGGRGASTLSFLLIAGGIALWIAQRRIAWLLLALVPLALHLAASALHKFPFGGHVKFSMYWAPLGVILMGAAVAYVWQWNERRARRPIALWACLVAIALIGVGSLVRDFVRPAKTTSDLRARDFARWLWNDLPIDSVVVCAHTDLHKDFTIGLRERLNWSASFYCNALIYSPRLRDGLPPDWSRVSSACPLRCVVYRPGGMPEDVEAQAAWLREMEQSYLLVTRDRFPLPRYSQSGRTLICVDNVEMFVFIPRP
ncbi:MAG: glycosyltransferase family 39 protein [Phycisphaeraceae bacterium]|nr:glycosyltransferase family 39 protein [Phycisphaeraceae bacterium]